MIVISQQKHINFKMLVFMKKICPNCQKLAIEPLEFFGYCPDCEAQLSVLPIYSISLTLFLLVLLFVSLMLQMSILPFFLLIISLFRGLATLQIDALLFPLIIKPE